MKKFVCVASACKMLTSGDIIVFSLSFVKRCVKLCFKNTCIACVAQKHL